MAKRICRLEDLDMNKCYTYVGKRIHYKDRDGMHLASKGIEYMAKIVQITEHTICLRLWAEQDTLHKMYMRNAMPYNWSITTQDLQRGTERIYEEVYK